MSTENSLELNVILDEMQKYCSFSRGKKLIENTEPSYARLVIKRDNELIREAMALTVHFGSMPFDGIEDLESVLSAARKGRMMRPSELLQELHLIRGIRGIIAYEKEAGDGQDPMVKELVSSLTVHQKTEKEIARCINEYGELMDTASSQLHSVRTQIRKNAESLDHLAQHFVQAHAGSSVDSIITRRNGRVVVLLKASEKNAYGGMSYGDSASHQASYVEPGSFVSFNNAAEQLAEEEKQEENRILRELTKEVQSVAIEELANLETCGQLDALFAKAHWGVQHNAVAAELTDERKIELVNARHPLIDPKKVVANTYHLEDPQRTLLITGPNTGGKTVSMKIIGLFSLMTFCGMPVTADSAVIPYFDRVFADVGDDQSVVSSLSSFSAHISKQADILRNATGNSLVLLDEIGSGTDPKEGEALAISILNALRERKCMTVCTTHYDRLKAYGKRHDDILIASVAFDMKKLMPTYRYIEGISGSSNAFDVAKRYGLPSEIINYARFLKNQSKSEEEKMIERLDRQLNDNLKKSEKLKQRLSEAEKEKKELKREKLALQKEKDEFQANLQAQADAYLDKVRHEADAVLKEIRKGGQKEGYHQLLKERKKLDASEKSEIKEEPDDYTYHVGDAVELRNSPNAYVCEVVRIEKKNIVILMNGREIRVKKNQIRPSMHQIAHIRPTATVEVKNENIFASMPSECNLIGMTVEEGKQALGDYLDQVRLHGLKTCRIIHGDGSGRLRKAVHEELKKNPDVKEWRLGMPQEGGTGATVVTMK